MAAVLLGVSVSLVGLASDPRRITGDLRHHGEAALLGHQLIDLGILVIGRDREVRGSRARPRTRSRPDPRSAAGSLHSQT